MKKTHVRSVAAVLALILTVSVLWGCESKEKKHKHTFEKGVCTVCGEEKFSEGLQFSEIGDSEYAIVSGLGSCSDTQIVIPSTYNGLPVKGIQESAFGVLVCGVTSIIIPDSVEWIGNNAFSACPMLESIELPEKLTSILADTFYECESLKSVTIPAGVTEIGAMAFIRCTALTDIHFAGTMAQWNAIEKETYWDRDTGNYTVHCSDGDIAKSAS